MPRFLSEEWFGEVEDRVRGTESRHVEPEDDDPATDEAAQALRLGQVVTGGPDGDESYTVILGGPGGDTVPRVLRGTTSRAEVVLVESYATAKGLVSGELTTGDAIAAGLIKVRGNAGRLVASRELLTRFGDALAGLAPDTTF